MRKSVGTVICAMIMGLLFGSLASVYAADTGPVDINTATAEQLEGIKGIGAVKAEAIIQYRTLNGPFKTAEDIKSVSGIGDKLYEQIKDQITVGAAAAPVAAPAKKQ